MTLKEFTKNLIDERFFRIKYTDARGNIVFENDEISEKIRNTNLYKAVLDISENKKTNTYKSIMIAFSNKTKIENFKRNFIKNILTDSKLLKYNTEKIRNEFEEVFNDCIFKYTSAEVVNKYSLSDLDGLFLFNKNIANNLYKFRWDFVGYSFGPLQINIATNTNVAIKILKACGYTTEEIDKIKNPPGISEIEAKFKDVIDPVKKNAKIASSLNEWIESNNLNEKLLKNKNIINEFSEKQIQSRIDSIYSDIVCKNTIYEDEVLMPLLVDYDNKFGFTLGKNKYLYKIMSDLVNEKKVFTRKIFMSYVFNTLEAKKGGTMLRSMKNRYSYIVNSFKPKGRNINSVTARKLISDKEIIDVVVHNEISFNLYNKPKIIEIYKKKLIDILETEIDIKPVEIDESQNEEIDKKQNVFNKINSELKIELNLKDNKVNVNEIYKSTVFLKQLFDKYCDKYKNYKNNNFYILVNDIKGYFFDLVNKNNYLRKNLDSCNSKLIELQEYSKQVSKLNYSSDEITIKNETEIVLEYFSNYCDAYSLMCKNEFAKTELMITGKISETNDFLISNEQTKNSFIDSFLFKKQELKKDEDEQSNFPFAILFDKNNFLELKELDYRNLEASLMSGNFSTPSKMSCRRMWIILYFILAFLGHKKTYYTNIDPKDFLSMIKKFFENIKKEDWNNHYSDEEKTFACLYPFVRYRNNPFTGTMLDKGFNKSQEQAKKLREYVESNQKEFIDSIKESVYGENKIYDIIQSIADIAAELSSPISLYSDFDIEAEGGNAIGGFLNSCVSSIEMQTAMLLYDFLFNIQIRINGKDYSLNDLNNMIKTFNLILEYSKTENGYSRNYFREELIKNSTFYINCKNRGFYTYLKKDLDNDDETTRYVKEYIGDYFLEDEEFAFNIVEYLVHKEPMCKRGDINEISSRFISLEFYEWLSIYAAYRLRTVDKKFISSFPDYKLFDYNLGYVFIKNFVNSCILESQNDDADINFVDPYLENISNDVFKNDKEFMNFKQLQTEAFIRFKRNLINNRKKCIDAIAKNLSDDKMYDWLMKMMPSYQLIANAFGLSTLDSLNTLDEFLKKLVENVNVLIKVIFDKWKVETIETLKVRRFSFIDKENYYYIQAFPVMIDWLVRNLEVYITSCTETFYDSGIDYNKEMSNEERFEKISKDFLILLKEEVAILSPTQLEKFKEEFRKVVLSVTDIDKEKAEKLLEDILFINYIKDVSKLDKLFEFLTPKQTVEVMEKLEELNKQ